MTQQLFEPQEGKRWLEELKIVHNMAELRNLSQERGLREEEGAHIGLKAYAGHLQLHTSSRLLEGRQIESNTSVCIPKPFQWNGIQVPPSPTTMQSFHSQVGGGTGLALQQFNQRGQFIQSHPSHALLEFTNV